VDNKTTNIKNVFRAGSIFVSGHDPIWHSVNGGNLPGAKNLATTGIGFARDGSALPFLFVESTSVVASHEAVGRNAQRPFCWSGLRVAV
jgi:hypothetical protein